ncbi:hypothetical protein H1Z61_02035 [Bacillus aquiflavi]|uniref:GH18 domain-containing protein n=1 Tax=Bacillus aquiflavi TaxID=2672567 RepID=A0A6B3VPT4_9BACI|nr:glycosyl hydrolase family 18 protein [Bacillus aquiflavi]MBA4535945.1 hypothetical protein [Bacillus aquiflavi]NEY80320.1 hypothetical protein [Bacillus aquiflavi]UAC49815.1 glycosylase [Bacillus aquiflavi]
MKKYVLFFLICTVGAVSLLMKSSPHNEKYSVSFLYFGETDEYVKIIDHTRGNLNVISPHYFDLNDDGTLKITEKYDDSFIEKMNSRSIKVVPFISNHWDQKLARKALKKKEKLAGQLADFIKDNNLDGISVDFENLTETDRNDYVDFISLLRKKLPKDKEISVCIPPNPHGNEEGYLGSFHYEKLTPLIDHYVLMTYDQSYEGSEEGPVASLPWVEKSIDYVLSRQVPPSKIVMGIPFYGRIWSEDGNFKGISMGNNLIQKMINRYPAEVSYNENLQSPKVTLNITENNEYFIKGKYHIWYEDQKSITAKLKLVHKYNLKGAASWALTQETEETWTYFKDVLNNQQ